MDLNNLIREKKEREVDEFFATYSTYGELSTENKDFTAFRDAKTGELKVFCYWPEVGNGQVLSVDEFHSIMEYLEVRAGH